MSTLHANIAIPLCSAIHSKIARNNNFVLMRTGPINYDVYSLDYASAVKHTKKDLEHVIRSLLLASALLAATA